MKNSNVKIDLDYNIVAIVENELGADNKDNVVNNNIEQHIQKIVETSLELEAIKDIIVNVSIQNLTKDDIQKINMEYREIDSPTDVLSFPIFEKSELDVLKEQKSNNKCEIILGDIFLCMDIVKEQAKEFQTGILRETLYMITHGICHLLGYDHLDDEEKKDMRDLEEKILDKVGVCSNG